MRWGDDGEMKEKSITENGSHEKHFLIFLLARTETFFTHVFHSTRHRWLVHTDGYGYMFQLMFFFCFSVVRLVFKHELCSAFALGNERHTEHIICVRSHVY